MKIGSVKIEKEVFEQVFTQNGIEPLVAEIKFPYADRNEKNLYKKTIAAVKRTIKKQLPDTAAGRRAFLANCHYEKSFVLEGKESKEIERALRMMRLCAEPRVESEDELAYIPGAHKYPAFTPLFATVKASFHKSSRSFKNDFRGEVPIHLLDYATYAAERLLVREVRRFTMEHPDAVKFALLQKHSSGRTLFTKYACDESMEVRLRQIAAEYGYAIDETLPKYVHKQNLHFEALLDGDMKAFDDYPSVTAGLMLHEFLHFMSGLREKAIDRSNEKASYAKAFQTKKHIPKTHQERMNDNVFLEAHGFVELDQDVDLNKFATVEEDYEELRRYFPYPRDAHNSFRIKKLGNYRAGGIYFVGFNATIFDINHVDSFVHEVFHQLDYTYSETREKGTSALHESTKFRTVYELYKHHVEENIKSRSETDPFRVQWYGRTKFNKEYYLKEAEAFARLGEIVIASIGDPENGLHKNLAELEGRPEYPTHPEIITAAKRYFAEVLPFIKLTNGVI